MTDVGRLRYTVSGQHDGSPQLNLTGRLLKAVNAKPGDEYNVYVIDDGNIILEPVEVSKDD